MDKDKQIKVAEYAISHHSGANPKARVSVSTLLLAIAKDKLQSETDYSMDLTNPTIINYALLSLLEPDTLDKIRYDLSQTNPNSALVKLLNTSANKNANPNGVMNRKLDQIYTKISNNQIELDGVTNALSWLIGDRSGILNNTLLESGDEAYNSLRNDKLKSITDSILRAGFNENDRQRHLDNR